MLHEAPAKQSFWRHWGDGKAELSGYNVTTERYGHLRKGKATLIYVTEPMDRRVWIKDDAVAPPHRVEVLKLNFHLTFRTGIYPYSVLTSVFSPVERTDQIFLSPAKIALSVQEWCGHVYQRVVPLAEGFDHEIHSYFASEGDRSERVAAGKGTLYEDALWIQLRELIEPFAGGKNWSGKIVPSLWIGRKDHQPPKPVDATIVREVKEGPPATVLYRLRYGSHEVVYEVEKEMPHRILRWQRNDGERATLLKTTRLPYWQLNNPGDEHLLRKLGFTDG